MGKQILDPSTVYERLCLARQAIGVAGIDEVGRGALAGPLVVCAVMIRPSSYDWLEKQGLRDSKLLSEKRREQCSHMLREHESVWYALGKVESDQIDQEGIESATQEAMKYAVQDLQKLTSDIVSIDHLLVDGRQTIPGLSLSQTAIVKGDMLCLSIAAASIIAKVERDTIMKRYGEQYPEYGFTCHVGYGTTQHREAILQHGPCVIHRKTFLGKIISQGA